MNVTEYLPPWHGQGGVSGKSLRLADIAKPLAFSLAGNQRHAILIVDACGIIRFAVTRELFGWSDEELSEIHLPLLVPSLPFREATPGYNVAYARLTFADRGWQPHRAVGADGNEFPVELSVHTVPIGRSYALLFAIRETPAVEAGLLARSATGYAEEAMAG
jgi:hypothetical protein